MSDSAFQSEWQALTDQLLSSYILCSAHCGVLVDWMAGPFVVPPSGNSVADDDTVAGTRGISIDGFASCQICRNDGTRPAWIVSKLTAFGFRLNCECEHDSALVRFSIDWCGPDMKTQLQATSKAWLVALQHRQCAPDSSVLQQRALWALDVIMYEARRESKLLKATTRD